MELDQDGQIAIQKGQTRDILENNVRKSLYKCKVVMYWPTCHIRKRNWFVISMEKTITKLPFQTLYSIWQFECSVHICKGPWIIWHRDAAIKILLCIRCWTWIRNLISWTISGWGSPWDWHTIPSFRYVFFLLFLFCQIYRHYMTKWIFRKASHILIELKNIIQYTS